MVMRFFIKIVKAHSSFSTDSSKVASSVAVLCLRIDGFIGNICFVIVFPPLLLSKSREGRLSFVLRDCGIAQVSSHMTF